MTQFKCIRCGHIKPVDDVYVCSCGGLYEVHHSFGEISLDQFDGKLRDIGSQWSSGVWRYKELIHPEIDPKYIVSRPEGNTNLYKRKRVAEYAGIQELYLKHEGENPSGSFKDRGMTVGVSVAVSMGASKVAIMRIFVFEGMIIGILGTLIGLILGVSICYICDTYKLISLPMDVYYIAHLPFKMEIGEILIIVVSSLVICFLATIYPSLQASKLDPVESIRYE